MAAMEECSTAGTLHTSLEQNGPSDHASCEQESCDETQKEIDSVVVVSDVPEVVTGSSHTPPSSDTATTEPSSSSTPETDPPPPYDSLSESNQETSQPLEVSTMPPSYASANRLELQSSSPAGDPGGEGEADPPERMRKKPCVTVNIEGVIDTSQETWCSLTADQGASPAPSLQQQEGAVHDFRSSDGKSVFFYVQDETEEAPTVRGCDNLGFVADEAEGSQTEGFVPPLEDKPTPDVPTPDCSTAPVETTASTPTQTVSSTRTSSNPECLAVPRDETVRWHNFGTNMGKATAPSPILRKRSTSRGRPEPGVLDSPAESQVREIVFTHVTGDRQSRHVTHTGSDETGSPGTLRKIFSSPYMGLSRSPSTKSCRSFRGEDCSRHRYGGQHVRPTQGPPSVREEGSRHHYMLQQHLYRNSRRNVQEKLHRQLSESDYYNHLHHHYGRHHSLQDTHDHHHGHARGPNSSPHPHRTQSQRGPSRLRHEPLRRHNTYGNELYLKFGQELEERCQRDDSPAASVRRGEEGEEENTSIRRVSHYRQEGKGLTDVERWVGVHGGIGEDGTEDSTTLANAPTLPGSPTTPHIIVSAEEDDAPDNLTPKVRQTYDNGEDQCDSSASNVQVTNNGAVPTTVNGGPQSEEKRPKLSLTMNSLDLPDARHPSLDFTNYGRRTRRTSMNDIVRRMGGSQTQLPLPTGHHHMRRSSSRNSLEPSVLNWKQEGNDSLIACVSALYGKLLVVMGMAFPIAEVISHDIPISFYNGFYLYLYIGSIGFLIYAYVFLLQSINIPTSQLKSKFQSLRNYVPIPDLNTVFPRRSNSNTNTNEGTGRLQSKDQHFSDTDKESDRASINTMSFKPPKFALTESNNHGSMYLKMGAVLFGIGSMIYSGLEVGQFFELQADDSCADILLVISPAARMVFTFIQMYFIFLNSRVAISRHRIIARFGLMHMIGTNLCIWLNVLVQETKHEIINLRFGHGGHHGGNLWALILNEVRGTNLSTGYHGDHDAAAVMGDHGHDDVHAHDLLGHDNVTTTNSSHYDHHEVHDNHEQVSNIGHASAPVQNNHGQVFSIYECSRSELMGELVDNASPFLFPCTIEYSLLSAGVLYVVWNNINKPEVTCDGDSDFSTYVAHKARHHYSVDCAHANRGLFMGILILVLTIISLILFFVLINNEAYKSLAIMEANIIELSVYSVATVTVVVGMIQMRELEFVPDGDIELDNILLLIAQTGVYIYTSFTIIGGHFTMSDRSPFMVLPLLSAIITLTQTTLQTIFILDATRRCCHSQDQLDRKPGREMVTFLLVCNLAMWAINTFETSRADAHPTQLNFYGIWAWTIISHISMPLAIFYRFHVTVCLCEIWKRSYKLKHEYY